MQLLAHIPQEQAQGIETAVTLLLIAAAVVVLFVFGLLALLVVYFVKRAKGKLKNAPRINRCDARRIGKRRWPRKHPLRGTATFNRCFAIQIALGT